jgi:hypothetical protein
MGGSQGEAESTLRMLRSTTRLSRVELSFHSLLPQFYHRILVVCAMFRFALPVARGSLNRGFLRQFHPSSSSSWESPPAANLVPIVIEQTVRLFI